MEEGKYQEAGVIFEDLGLRAMERRIARAPNLFLQAGRAFIEAEDNERGLSLLRRGLLLMARMGQARRLPFATKRVLDGLRGKGLQEESEELEREIKEILAKEGISLSDLTIERKIPKLPGKCSQCGGTVYAEEVEWSDQRTAKCDYCGSVIRALE
jgi:hypothetical protein